MSGEALRRVAGLLGIATRHVDALGVWHEPDDETLSRLVAADPASGPVARVVLPNRLPVGFHGNWVPDPG